MLIWLFLRASIRDLRLLKAKLAHRDECTYERRPRKDMHVMTKLQVLPKVQRLRRGRKAVRLEEVQSVDVPWEPQCNKILGEDVQRDLSVGD